MSLCISNTFIRVIYTHVHHCYSIEKYDYNHIVRIKIFNSFPATITDPGIPGKPVVMSVINLLTL